MPLWTPQKLWEGQECFIIGGGPSLKGIPEQGIPPFDWSLLVPEHTIGCNDAYLLGEDICKVCIFGDSKWFRWHKDKLAEFKNPVFTNEISTTNRNEVPWLMCMRRVAKGLHPDALGWNGNTGASAINLALLFGASKVYLLGFDMKLMNGKSNWHENPLDKPNPTVYSGFIRKFADAQRDLKVKFPGCEVYNVTRDSELNVFPKLDFDTFWKERMERKVA